MKSGRLFRGMPCLAAALLIGAVGPALPASPSSLSALSAQDVRGVVRDAGTGDPIEDVLVRADSSGRVTLTKSDGSFVLSRLKKGAQTVTFERIGYAPSVVAVTLPTDDVIDVAMEPAPFEMDPLEAEALSFETRYRAAERELDVRVARLPGDVRVAGSADLRPYDHMHWENRWAFYTRELRLEPEPMNEDQFRIVGRTQRPEVYIDDERTWLYMLVESPLATFCRVELYQPPRGMELTMADVPLQIRAYTCRFMAEVAAGEREMRKWVNHGNLIAGPGGE